MPSAVASKTSAFLRWGIGFACLGLGLSVWVILGIREVAIVRFATFNVSMSRDEPGQLARDLRGDDEQARAVAEVIQRVAPDVLLLNEFDYDAEETGLDLFLDRYLGVGQNGAPPIRYRFKFVRPVNTGEPSGMDLDRDGVTDGPGDALGTGAFPGKGGMVLLSRYPILASRARTFRSLLWRTMPAGLLPDDPGTPEEADWYSSRMLEVLPLSSKSHWDVSVQLSQTLIVHVLASHPTPPVFDGDEDRNGRRNHDEIRFWGDYAVPELSGYVVDDAGVSGGLAAGAPFVIMGDLNADPVDGDSVRGAIAQLLDHPRVREDPAPRSEGAVEQARIQWAANSTHRGDSGLDTADFDDEDTGPGNLRVDYVLPSVELQTDGAGVFWPRQSDPLFAPVGVVPFPGTDHRLVWVDIRVE